MEESVQTKRQYNTFSTPGEVLLRRRSWERGFGLVIRRMRLQCMAEHFPNAACDEEISCTYYSAGLLDDTGSDLCAEVQRMGLYQLEKVRDDRVGTK